MVNVPLPLPATRSCVLRAIGISWRPRCDLMQRCHLHFDPMRARQLGPFLCISFLACFLVDRDMLWALAPVLDYGAQQSEPNLTQC